jgi:hypothetical protein
VKDRNRFCACCLAVILMYGCAATVPPPVRRADWHFETGVDSLLISAEADFRNLRDLQAQAGITYEQAGQRDRGTAGLAYLPGMLRVEVRGGPFSNHILTALSHRDSVTVISRNDYRKEPAGGSVLAQLGVDLDLGDYNLAYALFGMVEPVGADSLVAIEYPRADLLVATVQGTGRRRRILIDRRNGFVTREEIYRSGRAVAVREMRDYRLVDQVYLPQEVEIRQADTALILDYRSYKPNTGISAIYLTKGIP